MHKKSSLFSKISRSEKFFFVFIFLFLIFGISRSALAAENTVDPEDTISIQYFIDRNCDSCLEKEQWFLELQEENPSMNISIIEVIFTGDNSNYTEVFDYTESLGLGRLLPPSAIFFKGPCMVSLHGRLNFTRNNFDTIVNVLETLAGECPDWEEIMAQEEFTVGVAFISGIVSGFSPCVILITSFVSSTLMVKTSKKKLALLFSGFLLGILLMYILLTIALISTFGALAEGFFSLTIRLIFAVLMAILGLWYVLDAFNEESKLFKTPESLKSIFAKIAKKGTFFSSFVLGFVFSFLKLPCVGGIMSALIYSVAENPVQYTGHLIIFYIGLLLPLIILMILLARGLQKEKVDEIRKKYRPLIRYISGILILGLTLYAIWDLITFSKIYLLIPLLCVVIIPLLKNRTELNSKFISQRKA